MYSTSTDEPRVLGARRAPSAPRSRRRASAAARRAPQLGRRARSSLLGSNTSSSSPQPKSGRLTRSPGLVNSTCWIMSRTWSSGRRQRSGPPPSTVSGKSRSARSQRTSRRPRRPGRSAPRPPAAGRGRRGARERRSRTSCRTRRRRRSRPRCRSAAHAQRSTGRPAECVPLTCAVRGRPTRSRASCESPGGATVARRRSRCA